MKKFFLIPMFIIIIFLNIGFVIPLLNKNLFTGLIYFKIAKNIYLKENINKTLNNLHEFMIFNMQTVGINESFLPILDKYTYNVLVDGYSACDGSAASYMWVLMFMGAKSATTPLYNDEFTSSPHTVLVSDFNNKKIIIDSVFNISFLNKENKYASLNDICKKNINLFQKNQLDNKNYNYNIFCNTQNIMSSNPKIPKILINLLYLIPNWYLDIIIKESIKIKFYNDNFKTARHYFLVGNYKKSKEYFDKIDPSNALIVNVKEGAELNEDTINKTSVLNPVNTYHLTKFYQKLIAVKKFDKLLPNDFNNNQMLFDLYNGFSNRYKLFKIISDTKN